MAEEVKVVQSVETPKEAVKVETPTTVSVQEYEALKTKFAELETGFKEKVNQASRAEREKFDKQLAKAKLSAEEQVKIEQEEKLNVIIAENNALKTEKKQAIVRSNLVESGLPPLLANDIRLINAEVDDIPKIIKELKREYGEYLKESQKPAVVGTAPKTPTQENPLARETEALVKKYPHLQGLLNKGR
jgi:hypothetical protein